MRNLQFRMYAIVMVSVLIIAELIIIKNVTYIFPPFFIISKLMKCFSYSNERLFLLTGFCARNPAS